ncbi:MAG: C40 family peptidase [Candidatus Eremiobacteraeota bacterium]|nr:C40 family peptidase [Candidatus Eremiobacteraeota bacterium]
MALAQDSVTPSTQSTAVAAAAVAEVQSPDVAMWSPGGASAAVTADTAQVAGAAKSHNLSKFASRILARTAGVAKGLTRDALRFLGVPYVFGGTSTGGFDCSGYVQHVFAMVGLHIPRTADAQYYAGSRVAKAEMAPGDLVFFQTYEPGPSHVGIYLGNGRFAHASSSHGVMVSSLSDSYWSARYIGAKRLASR